MSIAMTVTVIDAGLEASTVSVAATVPPPVSVALIPGQGPKGDPGLGAAHYVHTQATPSSTWTVNHNLGVAFLDVAVFSAGGVVVDAQVVHTSTNQAVISFNSPTAGTARISE